MGSELLLLAGMAFVAQISGAIFCKEKNWLIIRFCGWLINALAIWLAVSILGAYTPIWPAVVIGSIGFLLSIFRHSHIVKCLTDIALIITGCYLSSPPIPFTLQALFICIVILIRYCIDLSIDKIPNHIYKNILITYISFCVVAGALSGFLIHGRIINNITPMPILHFNNLIHAGIGTLHAGKKISLKTGGVAWMDKPSGKGTYPGAIIFHGANSAGSNQPTVLVLRRALIKAGYIVLSVDHVGYGKSPAPDNKAAVENWNPLPTDLAALEFMRSKHNISSIILIGHSMGVTEALRVLTVETNVAGVFLFGGVLHNPSSTLTNYQYKRFHSDRKLPYLLSLEKVIDIRANFYDDKKVLKSLPVEHPPILFAQFSHDWKNIIQGRDKLYDLIPGVKNIWKIDNFNHYLNTHASFGKLFIGDTQIMNVLVPIFSNWALKNYENNN